MTTNILMFRLQARSLFLTYPRCNGKKEELLTHLKEFKIGYAIIVEETHEDGAPHLHAFVGKHEGKFDIKNARALDFQKCHGDYKAAKGSYDENMTYLTKQDKNPVIFGDRPMDVATKREQTKKNTKEKNELIINTPTIDLVKDGLISIMNYLKCNENKTAFIMDNMSKSTIIKRECTWIYGKPGTGKSYWVRQQHPGLYLKNMNKWWDGYNSEDVVLLDDYDKGGACLSHYLKIWADNYIFSGEKKCSHCVLTYTKFYITSNYYPEEIFDPKDEMLLKAISRRFKIMDISELTDWKQE